MGDRKKKSLQPTGEVTLRGNCSKERISRYKDLTQQEEFNFTFFCRPEVNYYSFVLVNFEFNIMPKSLFN